MRYLKLFIAKFVSIWSHIYTYDLKRSLQENRTALYTFWIRNFFREVGDGAQFKYPIILQGRGEKNISVGAKTKICAHTVLGCWKQYGDGQIYTPEITIGSNCSIGEYCHISAINKITIGNGLLTGRFVYISDNAHGGLSKIDAQIPPAERKLISKGEVKIGNNVWIGDRVSIFSGVTIGDNVIIGAGAIVTHDIPSNSLAVGAPAKVIKSITEQ